MSEHHSPVTPSTNVNVVSCQNIHVDPLIIRCFSPIEANSEVFTYKFRPASGARHLSPSATAVVCSPIGFSQQSIYVWQVHARNIAVLAPSGAALAIASELECISAINGLVPLLLRSPNQA
jgi:hypothetical protein